jgi:3-oxoacyl-[acyl-carrier protein] reductase
MPGTRFRLIFSLQMLPSEEVMELAKYVGKYRDLHILINNAGGSKSRLWTSAADWDMIQHINLKVSFSFKYLGKLMKKEQWRK